MKENQTPHKVSVSTSASARSAENRNARSKDFPSKKSNKITGKSLNVAFASVAEDSGDSSPISEISDVTRSEEITTFLFEDPSSLTLLQSDVTPKKTTDVTGVSVGASKLDGSMFATLEAEVAVNFLRNAKPEVLNSVNASGPQCRKLMDEIIEYVIQDLCTKTPPEDRDNFAKVLSAKTQIMFLCFFIWIIGVSFVLFFDSDVPSGPTPT